MPMDSAKTIAIKQNFLGTNGFLFEKVAAGRPRVKKASYYS